MKYASIVSLAILAISTAAQADPVATLTNTRGPVLVNTGEGFQPAKPGTAVALKAGDRVLLRDDAMATIAYADCSVPLTKPSLYTVSKQPSCVGGGSVSGAYTITPVSASNDALAAEAAVVSKLVTGAFIIGTGAVLVDGLTNDESDPVTPN